MSNYNYINEIFLTEAFVATPKSLEDAVNNKRVISIFYKGAEEDSARWRKIMPVCFGEDLKGRQALRAFQMDEPTTTKVPAWKFFLIERIKNWNLSSNQNFDKPKDNYNPKDKHMRKIFASSNFNEPVDSELPKELDKEVDVEKITPDVVAKTAPDKLPDLSKVPNKQSFFDKVVKKLKSLVPDAEKRRKISIALRNKLFEGQEPVKRVKTLQEIYDSI